MSSKKKPNKMSVSNIIDARFRPCKQGDSIRCRFLQLANEVAKRRFGELKTPVDFLTIYTPTQAKELMFGKALLGPIRDHVELVSANDQCVRAGIPFESGVTRCWLCGCVIGPKEPKACEHIIPALRAIMFSGMITTQKVAERRDSAAGEASELLRRVTDNNYLWAHDNCNGSGAKGGMVLFKHELKRNQFVVDREKCGELREKIAALGRNDCYKRDFGSDIFNNLLDTINRRLVDINGEYNHFLSILPEEYKKDGTKGLNHYSEFTMEIVKIYLSAEAAELLLTDAERAARAEAEAIAQEKARKISAEQAAAAVAAAQAAQEEAIRALADQMEAQRLASLVAEANYQEYFKILNIMKTKKNESRGSKYHSIEDIGIELITRRLCAFYLQNAYKTGMPITLSLEINQLAEKISAKTKQVLAPAFDYLQSTRLEGSIPIITLFITIIIEKLIFDSGKQMSKSSGRSGIIQKIDPKICDTIAQLYVTIMDASGERLYAGIDNMAIIDPFQNIIFTRLVTNLRQIGIDYRKCQDVIMKFVSERLRPFQKEEAASQDPSKVHSDEQLAQGDYDSGAESAQRSFSQDSSSQLSQSDMSYPYGRGGKIKNVTKKNKKSKKTKNKKSKKNRKVKNIKKTKKYNQ